LQNGQASLAVSVDGVHWFLVNASPDLRAQMIATPQLFPDEGAVRHSPVCGVILTNGEVDAIAGLLSLREGAVFSIYAHPRVLATLAANSVFDVLDPARVPRIAVSEGVPFEPPLPDGSASGLRVEAFTVPGKVALYLEGRGERNQGDTIGLTLTDLKSGRTAHVLTACAAMTAELALRLRGADLVFFDGTLWRDDEMIRAGLAEKTGQRMGHMSMSGADGAVAALAPLGIGQKVFIHINNSNPALLPDSAERREVEAAGWTIPEPGRVFAL
jgi:pyrroloquinoline quinone biosynthesis protein B